MKRQKEILRLPDLSHQIRRAQDDKPALKSLAGSSSAAGFTLVEMVVVVMLVAILSVLGIGASFMPTMLRGRDTKRKHDLAQIATALEGYMNDVGKYPAVSVDGTGRIMGCGTDSVPAACSWGSKFARTVGGNEVVYMATLPSDSKVSNGRTYMYAAGPAGKAWKLYASLENTKDPVIMTFNPTISCGTAGNCNYGISSSNVTMSTSLAGY